MYIDQLSLRVPETTSIRIIWSKGSLKYVSQSVRTLHRLSWTCSWAELFYLPEVEVYSTETKVIDQETTVKVVSAVNMKKVFGEAKIDVGKICQLPNKRFHSTVKLSKCLDPMGYVVLRVELINLDLGSKRSVYTSAVEDEICESHPGSQNDRILRKPMSNRISRDPGSVMTDVLRSVSTHQAPKIVVDCLPDTPSSVEDEVSRFAGAHGGGATTRSVGNTDSLNSREFARLRLSLEELKTENQTLRSKLQHAVAERNDLRTRVTYLKNKMSSAVSRSNGLDDYNYESLNKQELIRKIQRLEAADKSSVTELEEELIKTKVKLAEVETEKEREIEEVRQRIRELMQAKHSSKRNR